jgi:hypothetical protein
MCVCVLLVVVVGGLNLILLGSEQIGGTNENDLQTAGAGAPGSMQCRRTGGPVQSAGGHKKIIAGIFPSRSQLDITAWHEARTRL